MSANDCPSEELETLTRAVAKLTGDFTDLKKAHDGLKADRDKLKARVEELERRQAADFLMSEMVEAIASGADDKADAALREAEILDRRLNEMNMYAFAFKARSN